MAEKWIKSAGIEPCPFCANEEPRLFAGDAKDHPYVECPQCGARGPSVFVLPDGDTIEGQDLAVMEWNEMARAKKEKRPNQIAVIAAGNEEGLFIDGMYVTHISANASYEARAVFGEMVEGLSRVFALPVEEIVASRPTGEEWMLSDIAEALKKNGKLYDGESRNATRGAQ